MNEVLNKIDTLERYQQMNIDYKILQIWNCLRFVYKELTSNWKLEFDIWKLKTSIKSGILFFINWMQIVSTKLNQISWISLYYWFYHVLFLHNDKTIFS